eukprot:CAMPEP_0178923604 /NCGR_PEP_ID=MMETSP0786-20121207/16825_1 /TAXON_ID=186022 /ORGANISM="Thalassionema frauenfeldii, Strain CCMP 1798" /LENGTH=905 /DNA_ID=CAMNT_0020598145 /DNA_START=184 /DNA_END=2901 /DNA_ORIENTATION=+
MAGKRAPSRTRRGQNEFRNIQANNNNNNGDDNYSVSSLHSYDQTEFWDQQTQLNSIPEQSPNVVPPGLGMAGPPPPGTFGMPSSSSTSTPMPPQSRSMPPSSSSSSSRPSRPPPLSQSMGVMGSRDVDSQAKTVPRSNSYHPDDNSSIHSHQSNMTPIVVNRYANQPEQVLYVQQQPPPRKRGKCCGGIPRWCWIFFVMALALGGIGAWQLVALFLGTTNNNNNDAEATRTTPTLTPDVSTPAPDVPAPLTPAPTPLVVQHTMPPILGNNLDNVESYKLEDVSMELGNTQELTNDDSIEAWQDVTGQALQSELEEDEDDNPSFVQVFLTDQEYTPLQRRQRQAGGGGGGGIGSLTLFFTVQLQMLRLDGDSTETPNLGEIVDGAFDSSQKKLDYIFSLRDSDEAFADAATIEVTTPTEDDELPPPLDVEEEEEEDVSVLSTLEPTPAPTPMPTTLSPTLSPVTPEPTRPGDTSSPTVSPTTAPPTPEPTEEPTPEPTPEPTEEPTSEPTEEPTPEPTPPPSPAPTPEPTADPTPAPVTPAPTFRGDTESPTVTPTTAPPSAKPTPEPTEEPTPEPTPPPTPVPSPNPTPLPTSSSPTRQPTRPPTMEPTADPTPDPTSLPTADPTVTPTPLPTTLSPTSSPTAAGFYNPGFVETLADMDDDEPLYLVEILSYREFADYEDGNGLTTVPGADTDKVYRNWVGRQEGCELLYQGLWRKVGHDVVYVWKFTSGPHYLETIWNDSDLFRLFFMHRRAGIIEEKSTIFATTLQDVSDIPASLPLFNSTFPPPTISSPNFLFVHLNEFNNAVLMEQFDLASAEIKANFGIRQYGWWQVRDVGLSGGNDGKYSGIQQIRLEFVPSIGTWGVLIAETGVADIWSIREDALTDNSDSVITTSLEDPAVLPNLYE